MDEELRQLALLALRNAFYKDFSDLVNSYMYAAEATNGDAFSYQLQDMCSVFARCDTACDMTFNIWTQNFEYQYVTTGHHTIFEALEFERATEVHLQGELIFKRVDGEWQFVD